MEELRISTVKRTERIRISVNGRETYAYKGETVLAALHAAGYRVLRRDKNGQARGAFCGMGICYDCLVTINGIRNQRSCMFEVEEGMEIAIDEP
ncbi:MAG: (2Fe-2S)-binding protein [Deltaproteobacteria bacterium]|nr:(2Fe-2S)-binding protein [Deltaproteobacteria bacterium]MBW2077219.1 (2Fe-2S)-binding protein [Deltaproteobacteria bacterium]MBW2311813.1 (2Fe-2S)-binding protein [Deltaproteobacteria bacterium]RLB31565.1 MAG: (2Fe-2S)-binding protein [Deltaproteobacteria bacterium]